MLVSFDPIRVPRHGLPTEGALDRFRISATIHTEYDVWITIIAAAEIATAARRTEAAACGSADTAPTRLPAPVLLLVLLLLLLLLLLVVVVVVVVVVLL